jgi:hypothetical protein
MAGAENLPPRSFMPINSEGDEMSDESVMKQALQDSASKYAKDPIENRGPANPAAEGPNLTIEPAPHMRSYAPPDNSAATRARNAETDKNLSTAPTPKKP